MSEKFVDVVILCIGFLFMAAVVIVAHLSST